MRPESLKINSFKSRITRQHHKQDQETNILNQVFGGIVSKCNSDQMSTQGQDDISEVNSHKTSHSSSLEESLILENGIFNNPREESFSGFKVIKVEMNSQMSENKNRKEKKLEPAPKTIKLLDSIIYEVSDCNESIKEGCESINNSLKSSVKSNQMRGINRFDSAKRLGSSHSKNKIESHNESFGKSQLNFTTTELSKSKKENEVTISEFDLVGKLNRVNENKNENTLRKTDSLILNEDPSNLPLDSRIKAKNNIGKEVLKKRVESSKLIKKIELEETKSSESLFKNNKYQNNSSKANISTTDVSKTSLESPIKEELVESNPLDLIAQIFGGSFSEKKTTTADPKKLKEVERTTEDMMIKFLSDLGIGESNREMERIKNMMVNQKNLKLKDYLRLTSLSKDSKFDRYSKSLTKKSIKAEASNNNLLGVSQKSYLDEESSMLKSRSFIEKSKSPIDTERSIELIKASLKKKLDNAMKTSYNLFKEVDEGSKLVGEEYEDLVFMCNYHRVYDENMFKTVQLLEELFEEYQSKRNIKKTINEKVLNDEKVTHEDLFEIINSPTKKKKKAENNPLDFIQKLLLNLKIIKNSEIKTPKDSITEFD